MEKDTFLKNLQTEINELRNIYPLIYNDGIGFTQWVLENVFLISSSESRLANCDGSGDGGLDGFYVDEEENVIRLIQCKYSDEISREARESFISLPNKLSDSHSVAVTNPLIYDQSCRFNESIERNYDVFLSFVYLGETNPNTKDELNNLLLTTLPLNLKDRVKIEIIGLHEIINKYLSKSPYMLDIPASKELNFAPSDITSETETESSYLYLHNNNYKALVLTVKGNELAKFGNTPNMFGANFRYALDNRNRTNSKIADTIETEDHRDNIWSYNNGITIVCDDFDTPDSINKNVKLYRPQIVNGCQTVSVLNRPSVKRYSHETFFLVRVIASNDAILQKSISTYTNTQTKVSDRTFRSNDPIQKSLQRQFKNLTPSYFYDCKEGEWDSLSGEQKQLFSLGNRRFRKIINTDCAKGYLSFHGQPIHAKSSPKLIWDISSTGFYENIFPNNRISEELLLPYLINEKVQDYIDTKLTELANSNDYIRLGYLKHCNTHLVALVGHILTMYTRGNLSLENHKKFIANLDSFSDKLITVCDSVIFYEVDRANNESMEATNASLNYRNYFLKNSSLKNMKNYINQQITSFSNNFYISCGLN